MKYIVAAIVLFTVTFYAGSAPAQDTGEISVYKYDAYGDSYKKSAKWKISRYPDGLQVLELGENISWTRAAEFCRQSFGSQSDWRLPSRRDIDRIVSSRGESALFWLDEPEIYYFLYPGNAPRIDRADATSKSDNQNFPLCVADGGLPVNQTASKAGPRPADGKTQQSESAEPSSKKERIAQANYERLRLERDSPGSDEALRAAQRYNELAGVRPTPADVAAANYLYLKLEKESPGSRDAARARVEYEKTLAASKAPVTKAEKAAEAKKPENKAYVFERAVTWRTPFPVDSEEKALEMAREQRKDMESNMFTTAFARDVMDEGAPECKVTGAATKKPKHSCAFTVRYRLRSDKDPGANKQARSAPNGMSR